MKKLLLALLLGLPGIAQAQFGTALSGFGKNVEYIIENGTFTLNGSWDFDNATLELAPCAEGQIYKYQGGQWVCAEDGGAAGEGGAAPMRRDDFTTLADGIETDFTLSEEPAGNSVSVYLDGLFQRENSDYTITSTLISFTTPPSAETTSLYAVYHATFTESQLTAVANEQLMSVTVESVVNGATYEVMKTFIFPGSDLSGTPVRVLTNEFRSAGTGSCDFRIYDLTNALVIHETLGVVNTDPATISNETGITNVDPAPAIWELQGKRNGGGTSCEMDYLTIVWR